jgi:hypothetical protein
MSESQNVTIGAAPNSRGEKIHGVIVGSRTAAGFREEQLDAIAEAIEALGAGAFCEKFLAMRRHVALTNAKLTHKHAPSRELTTSF